MSNTNKILSWNSSLLSLAKTKRIPKNLQKVYDSDIKTLLDLIWVLPLNLQKFPDLKSFDHLEVDKVFLGRGKLINLKLTPAYGRKGKGKIQLFNIQAVIKDSFSNNYLNLRWFNSYPNVKNQLANLDEFDFLVTISEFNGILQGVNPQISPKKKGENILIQYPTINGVSGTFIKSYINSIPEYLWEQEVFDLYQGIYKSLGIQSSTKAFKTLHGKSNFEEEDLEKSRNRLIYEEFLQNQIKVLARKEKNKSLNAVKISLPENKVQSFVLNFPYILTKDQVIVFKEIQKDLMSGRPMMRIIQGDVGSGKTTVAIAASFLCLDQNFQVALMCPTESLANQHANEFSKYFNNFNIALLTGSTKPKAKKTIYEQLFRGNINLIIGTHALIQDSVEFQNLGLIIIDEQHKFGVKQRLKLASKGSNAHTLIMSATPIPRTLQLAQYGDLDISTIKSMPSNRKGIKTRIVSENNFEKFLSFIKTRISLKEQVYIVTAAIEESELDINYLYDIFDKFKSYFPDLNIGSVHGKDKPDTKKLTLSQFKEGKIDILVSTSVIEVGIDNPNSTVMAIYNPERFGLSSLHQLRGRVGRGEKPGFCFLITDQKTPKESIDKMKVLEDTNDGFIIAEADLKNRGEGDLFGTEQSGMKEINKIASVMKHLDIFNQVIESLNELKGRNSSELNSLIRENLKEQNISSTI